VILELTKRINGGENGLSERTAYFNKFYKALNS
jgi:predicted chitinase